MPKQKKKKPPGKSGIQNLIKKREREIKNTL